MLFVAGLWTCASTFLVTIRCKPGRIFDSYNAALCGGEVSVKHIRLDKEVTLMMIQIPRLYTMVVINICVETCVILLSSHLFCRLQMRLSTKLTVVGAFAFRIGYVAFAMHPANYKMQTKLISGVLL